jgi:hypothetical protein
MALDSAPNDCLRLFPFDDYYREDHPFEEARLKLREWQAEILNASRKYRQTRTHLKDAPSGGSSLAPWKKKL